MSYFDPKNPWHSQPLDKIFDYLGTESGGLSNVEVQKRLLLGKNVIVESKPPGLFLLFLSQFKSPLIYVLIIAAVVIILLGEFYDSIIIFIVLILNSLLGLFQENKANQTLRSLKQFSKGRAVVIRDGIETEIDDSLLVVGDVVVLRGGDKVPADCRIVNTQDLKINESSLSGRWLKKTTKFMTKKPPYQREKICFIKELSLFWARLQLLLSLSVWILLSDRSLIN